MEKETKKMYFVSRHPATDEQKRLAEKAGYLLVEVGDRDAFLNNTAERSAGSAEAV